MIIFKASSTESEQAMEPFIRNALNAVIEMGELLIPVLLCLLVVGIVAILICISVGDRIVRRRRRRERMTAARNAHPSNYGFAEQMEFDFAPRNLPPSYALQDFHVDEGLKKAENWANYG